MGFPNLPLTFGQPYGEPPPRRSLRLECRIGNPTKADICILDCWIRVTDGTSMVIAEGKLFQQKHAPAYPATIRAGEKGVGAIHIDLSSEAMHRLEEHRAGKDLTLWFDSRVLISSIEPMNDQHVLQQPFETQFGSDSGGRFEYLIPQSEWIKLLRSLAWSELEVIEMPLSRIRSSQPLARALSYFEDAQRNYRIGHWDQSMVSCRKAFEAIVHDGCGELDMKKALQVFESIMGEGEKAKRINELAKEFGNYLHLARHDNPEVKICRADAELALWLTGSFVAYLGQQ